MGNGQHRNRRGARPRPAPHKHGGAGNPGRTTTQLIPPVALASAAGDGIPTNHGAGEDAGDQSPEPALPATPDPLATGLGVETHQDAPPSVLEEASQERRRRGGHAPQPALAEAEPVEESIPESGASRAPTGAAPAGRGRFDRFYTPGQGPRAERSERAERIAPPVNPVLPPVVTAPIVPPRRIERAPVASEPVDEDDGPDYTGPRSDVRGNVGTLIDSLHEVFARDRAMASQGGVARCGVCYLHFPTGELIYRDAEGFYVCESCAHALGAARVTMVRRQQRQ